MGKVVQMRDYDDIEDRVITVVSEQTGWNRLAITPASRIEADLGCTGDDARELLLKFESVFGVDMRAVEFDKHFHNEVSSGWPLAVALVVAAPISFLAMHLIGAIARAAEWSLPAILQGGRGFIVVYILCGFAIALLTKFMPHIWRPRKAPITVQHLIDAARTRRWPFSASEGQTP